MSTITQSRHWIFIFVCLSGGPCTWLWCWKKMSSATPAWSYLDTPSLELVTCRSQSTGSKLHVSKLPLRRSEPKLRFQTKSPYVQNVPDGKCPCPDFRALIFSLSRVFRCFQIMLFWSPLRFGHAWEFHRHNNNSNLQT